MEFEEDIDKLIAQLEHDYPKTMTAIREAEVSEGFHQRRIGNALWHEFGSPKAADGGSDAHDGSRKRLAEFAENLKQAGYAQYSETTLAKMRATAYRFRDFLDPLPYPWSVCKEAGTPEKLKEFEELAKKEGKSLSSQFIKKRRREEIKEEQGREEREELNRLQEKENKARSELRSVVVRLSHAEKIGDSNLVERLKNEKEVITKERGRAALALKRKKEDMGIIKESHKSSGSTKGRSRILPGFGTGLDFTICGDNLMWVKMDVQEVLKAAIKDAERAKEIYNNMDHYSDQRRADLIAVISDTVYPCINEMQKALDSLKQSWDETLALAKDQLKDPVVKAQAKQPSLTVVR